MIFTPPCQILCRDKMIAGWDLNLQTWEFSRASKDLTVHFKVVSQRAIRHSILSLEDMVFLENSSPYSPAGPFSDNLQCGGIHLFGKFADFAHHDVSG